MNLPGKILLGFLGSFLIYGVGAEVVWASPSVPVPPGATRISFTDLGGNALPATMDQVKAGDYLKALPKATRSLDNQRVVIQGFMIPTQLENSQVREFLLVRSQASCCFGFPLQVSDTVVVRMTGKAAGPLMDRTLNVVGRLHLQEQWDGKFLSSLYQLSGETVTQGGGGQGASPAILLPVKGRE